MILTLTSPAFCLSFLSPACMCAKSLQLCPSFCDPMESSPPGSSVHGGFPGKNTACSGLLCPTPGDLPDPAIQPCLLLILYCRRVFIAEPWDKLFFLLLQQIQCVYLFIVCQSERFHSCLWEAYTVEERDTGNSEKKIKGTIFHFSWKQEKLVPTQD